MQNPIKVIRRYEAVGFIGEGIICEHDVFHRKFSMEVADSRYLPELKNEITEFLKKYPQYQNQVYVITKRGMLTESNFVTPVIQSDNDEAGVLTHVKKKLSFANLFYYFGFITKLVPVNKPSVELSEKTPLLSRSKQ